jgi:hypothetical protein
MVLYLKGNVADAANLFGEEASRFPDGDYEFADVLTMCLDCWPCQRRQRLRAYC